MQETLEDFFKALRGSGLELSLTDGIEAGRAAQVVGLADREALKYAWGATLAKSLDDRLIFDACFDHFFSFDTFKKLPAAAGEAALPENRGKGACIGSGGEGGGGGGGGGEGEDPFRLVDMLLRQDQAGLAKALKEAARRVGLTDIWIFTQKGYYIQKLQEAMGLEQLDLEMDRLAALPQTAPRAASLKLVRRRLFEEVRDFVEKQLSLYGTAPTQRLHDEYLRTQKLSNIDRRDFRRMHDIVRKIAKRLAVTHSRKKRQETRGVLDFRKTLRRNVAYDGVLFETYWKTKLIDRPKVIAICDVSGSVRAYARFLLLFLYSLTELLSKIQAFAFTNRLVEVTGIFGKLGVEKAVDKVMKEVSGPGTDYGRVLLDIDEQLMDEIDNKTTVLILGDARNNRGDPQTAVLQLLHRRAKRVIWLNPEPRAFWTVGDSEMRHYLPYCHLAKECNTLRHLERIMDDLLRVSAAAV